jgi:DNA-binding response OmpR family regulator
VVFISSDHSETRRARVLEAGAAAFIRKPLDPEKLLAVLREVVPHAWDDAPVGAR